MKAVSIFSFAVLLLQTTLVQTQQPGDVPTILEEHLHQNLLAFFDHPRNHQNATHFAAYERVRGLIRNVYQALERPGRVDFITDNFNTTLMDYKGEPVIGLNFYLVFRGERYGTSSDQITAITAHYESNEYTPGTDNNGSGQTAMLEIAKALAKLNCTLEHTIVLVSNDIEEKGSHGVKHFIYNFLEPMLVKHGAKFQGALVMETMMNFNDSANSQLVPFNDTVFEKLLPDVYWLFVNNSRRGDFSLFVSRDQSDSPMNRQLHYQWYETEDPEVLDYKYKGVTLFIPFLEGLATSPPEYPIQGYFLRGDYKEFYYYNGTAGPLKALMITDSANWRGIMTDCYSQPCDDLSQITPDKISFLQRTAQTTLRTVLDMANYHCKQPMTTTLPPSTSGSPAVSNGMVYYIIILLTIIKISYL